MPSSDSVQRQRPHLALTMGDPASIGPEIILKALVDPRLTQTCDLTVIGTRSLLHQTYQQLYSTVQPLADPDSFPIIDIPLDSNTISQIIPGCGNAASGQASFTYLETAITQTLEGKFDSIVTAPIAKSCWKAAGYHYPGQTEVLAQKAQVDRFGMLFVGRSPYTGWTLRTLLATTHIPLNQVSQTLTPQLMSLKLDLLINCLEQDFAIKNPKIVISGLNPHSGENGQLGTEEKDWLLPWLETAKTQYPNVELLGLIPPDTLWIKPAQAWYGKPLTVGQTGDPSRDQPTLTMNNPADAYLALYHDQGLIPVKLMAFDQAINTTIGLPFIRTSPDHGTAFDIAGKGIARDTSLKAAIILAAELTQQRLK
ncbi:pyridoxal phosphate biosynthetic protein [Crocosphaera subtropica ATCC 51142]|uniref:4-hydroxythreonine-4-phosphate dehydrogenase n=1 Tax=Crocosphaera subtropica (strain ATCC 51142 / BH68) TaxID=43989 RepID=B1WU75_CROS5|nr:4-hydroxythreonine-4-phosphate dehydrogenase PdxA [Crocosphaera subtropica]ACB52137.1 pyridoxal phosphate biosynthetic protein [Crocosphaera subtropica ATCC 51142]